MLAFLTAPFVLVNEIVHWSCLFVADVMKTITQVSILTIADVVFIALVVPFGLAEGSEAIHWVLCVSAAIMLLGNFVWYVNKTQDGRVFVVFDEPIQGMANDFVPDRFYRIKKRYGMFGVMFKVQVDDAVDVPDAQILPLSFNFAGRDGGLHLRHGSVTFEYEGVIWNGRLVP